MVGKQVAEVGVETDKTVEAQIIEYTKDLVLVDLPGYGTSKFPPDAFADKFRSEDYNIFLCVFSGKFHQADTDFFHGLKQAGSPCLFVRSKEDTLYQDGKDKEELKQEIKADVIKQIREDTEIFFISNRYETGFDKLQKAIHDHLEDAYQDRWARSAKAYTLEALAAKKAACESKVTKYAGLAAVNGLNPIPGLGVAVDATVLLKLFAEIREHYGLSEDQINSLSPTLVNILGPIANKILSFSKKEGIELLLKQFAGRLAAKQFSKYIPFVGLAIASSAGFGLTKLAGDSYLEDCHQVAEAILKEELERNKRLN